MGLGEGAMTLPRIALAFMLAILGSALLAIAATAITISSALVAP